MCHTCAGRTPLATLFAPPPNIRRRGLAGNHTDRFNVRRGGQTDRISVPHTRVNPRGACLRSYAKARHDSLQPSVCHGANLKDGVAAVGPAGVASTLEPARSGMRLDTERRHGRHGSGRCTQSRSSCLHFVVRAQLSCEWLCAWHGHFTWRTMRSTANERFINSLWARIIVNGGSG